MPFIESHLFRRYMTACHMPGAVGNGEYGTQGPHHCKLVSNSEEEEQVWVGESSFELGKV